MGLARVRRLSGPVRREGRRASVTRVAMNVFWSVVALYAWTSALRVQPTPGLVGFLGAALVFSLVAAVLAAFMQPPERSPETLGLFRLRRPVTGDPSAGDTPDDSRYSA